jgi:predicted nucleotidyltransferase
MDLIIDKILFTEMTKKLELNEDGDDEIRILSFSTIKKEITEVAKDLDIERIYLFGSYVKGDMSPLSDIDLYMESEIYGLDYYGVVERFRNALHKKVDLLSNKTVLPASKIYDEIMKTGVIIYERQ